MQGSDIPDLPDNAELVNGRWWTPKMVMHFWNYSPSTFYAKAKGKTLRQMLYGANIRARVGERKFKDRTGRFSIWGREYSVAMVYYYMARYNYIDPTVTTYASFRGTCASYAYRNGTNDMLTGIDINCQRFGCNIKHKLLTMTDEEYARLRNNYEEFIDKHKPRARKELPQHFDPNDRYLECVQADPRMLPVFDKEAKARLPQAEVQIVEQKETIDNLSFQVLDLKRKLARAEMELANKALEEMRRRDGDYLNKDD